MSKNIVFMGTPEYAAKILQGLIQNSFNVLAVITQQDKAVGRKQILVQSAVKTFALKHNLKVLTPKSLKDEVFQEELKCLDIDFIIVAAYGKILPKSILELAPCINLHASLLPKYRGASPIQSAILNADEKSGVCTMLMDEGLDTGAILQSLECDIKDKNALLVFEELGKLATKLCVKTLNEFQSLRPQIQDESKASFCTKIKKENGLIDIKEQKARDIYQKYLAFYNWPQIFLNNGLKFIEIELVNEDEKHQAAQILSLEKDAFLLACKNGVLRIKKLQEAGKKVLDARTYLNGKRLKSGDYLY
ncbi:methionyl-tRNA formyltransferase [Campylobacter sp. MIT 97-5078]|uniref:methionyl-tRNA formyltransferase n=1 Tax=Campylobacter sp. MIT 97-5078 TaxID=1548153 RepID=UPI0005135544|nr:methionyl-tRNA formyltransferase [Campylobacter sp. MIT 97-5078]KGI56528.1 methionyl-tRNA formyltransferase [Campylobacter sp. MIT 97-5078]